MSRPLFSSNVKVCSVCERSRSVNCFGSRTNKGRRYLRHYCNSCRSDYRRKQYQERGYTETMTAAKSRSAKREKVMRRNGVHLSRWIVQDAKRIDKVRGLEFDIDRVFVDKLIQESCRYCGAKDIRMTLDRIDNSRGHTKNNVLPACIRCNLTRGNMPFEAWLIVAHGMRKARELGLFGKWDRKIRAS